MGYFTSNASSTVSGWSVHQMPGQQRWHWTAFGQRGGSMGTAATKADAESAAKRAAEGLKR